jgi:CheY-like chemotaxis protein
MAHPGKEGRADMSEGPHRVLVVEDHADSRELLAEFLEALGYDVDVAGNGVEALERLRGAPLPAAMLLDLMMPVMSGWELMRHVRADPSLCSLPVMVVSGAGDAHPLPEGIRGAMPKPVDLDALRTFLATTTRRS